MSIESEENKSVRSKNKKIKPKKYADEKFKHKEVVEFKKHKLEEEENDWEYWKKYYS
jgi:hypothetical protein|tara:strand:+ start:6618 stop:6788 length:171 start_codon:yes stop_codon:yes gene_type:complete